jgi:formate hydrogenlyase transcriptional activator
VGRVDPPLKVGTLIPLETIAGKVYTSGQPAIFRYDELSAKYAHTEWYQEIVKAELKVGCALPLVQNGRMLGVLVLGTRQDQESATLDLSFLQELAKLIALSLSNALRYEQVNESREKLVNARNYIADQIRTEFSFETIVGASKAIKDVLQQVETVAPTDSTVLILGETGTGKELIARAICDRSPRHDQGFIKVDCSAIPSTLMESELFGHEKGAFTGATTQRLGRFEIADKGTLFLDEVGDIPLELQPKLLRVLQDQAFERLGSNRTLHVDVRIIAATNRNLEKMVEKGEFREDLYYRLKVFPITIPPLRQRPDDIPPLVRHYVAKYAQRMKKEIKEIPAHAMEVFMRYPWPGNVRELQHFLERSVILSSGHVLQAPLLNLKEAIRNRSLPGKPSPRRRTMEEIERESILQALRDSNWVVGGPHGAAAKLGLKRTTLASRMESLGISRKRQ